VVDEHQDVDLLVSDYFSAKRVLDGDAGYSAGGADMMRMLEDGGGGVMNLVSVGKSSSVFISSYWFSVVSLLSFGQLLCNCLNVIVLTCECIVVYEA